MAKTIHHIAPNGHGGWCIRRDGEDIPIVSTDTKIKAINIGNEISRNQDVVVVIHEQKHKIARRNARPGDAPFPPPSSVPGGTSPPTKNPAIQRHKSPEMVLPENWLLYEFDNEATG